MLSSSTSVTCAAFCRAIFNIIMTPERISRSTRTAHGLVACNFPPQAVLLPSRRSAVCIIAMSVVPREIGEGGTLRLSPPNYPQFIFEQGHHCRGCGDSVPGRGDRACSRDSTRVPRGDILPGEWKAQKFQVTRAGAALSKIG